MSARIAKLVGQIAETTPWLGVAQRDESSWVISWPSGCIFCFESRAVLRFAGAIPAPQNEPALAAALLAWNLRSNSQVRFHMAEDGTVGADVILPSRCADITSAMQALLALFTLHLAGGGALALAAYAESARLDGQHESPAPVIGAPESNTCRAKPPLGFRTAASTQA